MGKCLKIGSLVLGSAILFGCANQNTGLVASADRGEVYTLPAQTETLTEHNPNTGRILVNKAKSVIGTPYILGGTTPGGFDCSGLVQWTYNHLGVNLPRTAREQASVGQKVNDVKDMREGDIVAFRHPKRGYHTGIYVGDGKFVHSPRKRSTVRINSLSDPYFRTTLLGARRVDLSGSEHMLASSTAQLEKMVAEKSHLSISERNIEKIRSSAKNNSRTTREVVKQKSKKQVAAASKNAKKKSTIASQARKIQSVKTVTGKSQSNGKNSSAHASLAKASKNATSKLTAAKKNVSSPAAKMVASKKNSAKPAVEKAKQKTSRTSAANSRNNHNKSVSMLTKKHPAPAARKRHS